MLQHVDVLCLSETRHKSVSQLSAAFPCHCIFHVPAARPVQGMGVAVLVHKKYRQHVQQLQSPCTSMQFLAVRLQPPAVPLPLVVVNCYIPPVGSPQLAHVSMRDQYMHLTAFLQSHAHAATVLGGDLNAHLHFAPAGVVSSTNESGAHLVDLVDACAMHFALKHDASQPPTFSTHHGSRGLLTSSPDHIVSSNDLPAQLSARVCTEVVGSDHFPVALRIRWHAFSFHDAPLPVRPHMRIRWQGRREAFTSALTQLIADGAAQQALLLMQDNGVHAAMDALVQTVLFAAIKSDHNLGAPRAHFSHVPQPCTEHSQPWFDATCKFLRDHYFFSLRHNGHGHDLTKAASGEYKAACRARQRQWAQEAVELLVDQATRDPRAFWRTLAAQTKPAPFAACASDVDACVSYFSSLFCKPDLPDTCAAPGLLSDQHDHVLNQPFTQQEVEQVLAGLRNGTACGPDGVPGEFYKYASTSTQGGDAQHILAEYFTAVFNAMFDQGSTPPGWGQALLTLIFKGGGDASDWSRYRPLAVTQVIAKVFASVLHARLSAWAESNNKHTPMQVGFRPAHSTTFNNFVMLHMAQKCKSQNLPLYCCFLDLRKAFDSVVRSHVWQRLFDMGVQGKFLHAVVALYQDVTYKVKFSNGVSPAFRSNIGLRQGCPLSPILFSFIIQRFPELVAMHAPNLGPKFELAVHGHDPYVPLLMFADDTANMGCAASHAQQLLDVFETFCDEEHLDMTFDKSNVVVLNASFQSPSERQFIFTFRGQPVARATEYVFLGLMTKAGRSLYTGMVKHAANRGYAAIAAIHKRVHQLGLKPNADIMLRLFEAVVMPNLTFGCEVWGPWILHCRAAPAGQEWWQSFTAHATSNLVEQVRLSFARTLLALKSSTPVWTLFRELGWYPIQIFVVQQLVRFMNKLWDMPDSTLARRALHESWNAYLLDDCRDNWAAKLHTFLQAAGVQHVGVVPGTVGVPLYNEHMVVARLQQHCHTVFLQPGLSPKLAAYHADFGDALSLHGKWCRAQYLRLPIGLQKLRLLARFRLSCHHLAIETGRWRGVAADDCVCTLCGTGAVQDEHHVLFRCPALSDARMQFSVLFGDDQSFTHVRSFFTPGHGHDLVHVVRQLCSFLQHVGGIYHPIRVTTTTD